PPYNDAEEPTAKSTGGALLEETKMREMTDTEVDGAAEITDDMLVLGDLTDLPPPGDEAAAIAFVSAMIERALVQPAESSSSPLIQERADHGR
ncbi:type IV secretory system conjugative DNA transfer family protein, partial [Sphingobium indicum]